MVTPSGRSEDCTIIIPDPDVSRLHARLILRNDAVWVQDENSRNAIFVNDKRVVRRPEELRPGGLVRLGEGPHVFTLELDDGDDASLVIPIDNAEEKALNDDVDRIGCAVDTVSCGCPLMRS